MSERHRKIAGAILIVVALIPAIIPLLICEGQNGHRYQTNEDQAWVLKEIGTERNGDIRLNEADKTTLELLYGIGPAYAERIFEEREKNGPFYYPEDLQSVSGIGTQTIEKFRTMIDMTINESRN
jgi:competence ComEA-like helix-hairpin-helix protein